MLLNLVEHGSRWIPTTLSKLGVLDLRARLRDTNRAINERGSLLFMMESHPLHLLLPCSTLASPSSR
jgi:hypothetical protein